jgi:hypothetical protein
MTDDDIEYAREILPEVLSDFTIDLFLGQDDSLLRRLEFSMRLAPPPGEPNDGLESVEVQAQLTFDDLDEPLEVEAPADALPYTALEELFGDILGPDFLSPMDEFMEEPTRT